MKTAILLCGHGSRSAEAIAEFYRLLAKVRHRRPAQLVSGGFLQFAQPSIMTELKNIYGHGLRDIIVQPIMLYPADHVKNDIPEILAHFQRDHPDVRLRYGEALGLCPPVIAAAAAVIMPFLVDGKDSELLVVGRGSPHRRITDQTINLCQKLHQQRLAIGQIRYCYGDNGTPALVTALEQTAHYSRVIILPFLLFPGRLVTEIYAEVDVIAEKYPAVIFDKAPPLGPQDLITDAVMTRINALT